VKFLCIGCDHVMDFAERQLPGDGTMAAVFVCDSCGHEVAMLTNPMETQLVSSLGVKVGGRTVPEQPFEFTRTGMAGGRDGAFEEPTGDPAPDGASARGPGPVAPLTPGAVRWTDDATDRLARVPSFVRGMVKRIYADWAAERGIVEITPEIMDTARSDLGLEGM
jgi:hypothetical protein